MLLRGCLDGEVITQATESVLWQVDWQSRPLAQQLYFEKGFEKTGLRALRFELGPNQGRGVQTAAAETKAKRNK